MNDICHEGVGLGTTNSVMCQVKEKKIFRLCVCVCVWQSCIFN